VITKEIPTKMNSLPKRAFALPDNYFLQKYIRLAHWQHSFSAGSQPIQKMHSIDRYCADIGYEKAVPVIKEWLADSSPNVRRAVTEGLRIWTGRHYFNNHPEAAINLLSRLRNDDSEYVRKSVGNALRDISKKHQELICNELHQWDITNKQIKQTHKLASKFLQKKAG